MHVADSNEASMSVTTNVLVKPSTAAIFPAAAVEAKLRDELLAVAESAAAMHSSAAALLILLSDLDRKVDQ